MFFTVVCSLPTVSLLNVKLFIPFSMFVVFTYLSRVSVTFENFFHLQSYLDYRGIFRCRVPVRYAQKPMAWGRVETPTLTHELDLFRSGPRLEFGAAAVPPDAGRGRDAGRPRAQSAAAGDAARGGDAPAAAPAAEPHAVPGARPAAAVPARHRAQTHHLQVLPHARVGFTQCL